MPSHLHTGRPAAPEVPDPCKMYTHLRCPDQGDAGPHQQPLTILHARCGGCRWARYADRTAQKAAWGHGHRQECAALRACAPRRPPASVRLAARVFWSQQGWVPCTRHAQLVRADNAGPTGEIDCRMFPQGCGNGVASFCGGTGAPLGGAQR